MQNCSPTSSTKDPTGDERGIGVAVMLLLAQAGGWVEIGFDQATGGFSVYTAHDEIYGLGETALDALERAVKQLPAEEAPDGTTR